MSSPRTARDLAAAFLSASGPPMPLPEIDVAEFLAAAASHGVLGLIYASVNQMAAAAELPRALVDGLRAGAHRQAAREILQRAELQRVVAAMHARGVDVLLMKGSSLAYDVYPDPAWRVRADTDVLIRETDRAAVRACLEDLGYACASEASGSLVAYQFHAERVGEGRVRHLCDVHWKIANVQRFAGALPFDEVTRTAIALPLIGAAARGLGRADALWLACVHRAAHHYDRDTLAWLYDVHLLVQGLDAAGVERFLALAARSRARRICLHALRQAQTLFGSTMPAALMTALEDGSEDEPSTVFLRPGVRRVDVLLDDLRALPGWRSRVRLVKEVLFPDANYMRGAFGAGSSAPVAWLYVRRIARGAIRWLRRGASATAQR
jgi:putative nucleotidyltransferase-like protein